MIPVSIVTGFLGSGKTTLIGRVIRDPSFGRTAVIVNEFGEIGLDHDLIASSDDSVLTLSTGCLCCAVQTDLARTLIDLARQRGGDYDRVLIETSGLSDPAPLLQSLLGDREITAGHQMASVVTVVDTIYGETNLLEHTEARHQVMLADVVMLSKSDLRPASKGLRRELDKLNPAAVRMITAELDSAGLFGGFSTEALTARLGQIKRRPAHDGIDTFSITRQRPLPALALTLFLQAMAEHCGHRLPRLKGLVSIEEMPGRPAAIHGVRHVFSAPEFLERWPSENDLTRIVFISAGVPRYFAARLLDVIEEEVRAASLS